MSRASAACIHGWPERDRWPAGVRSSLTMLEPGCAAKKPNTACGARRMENGAVPVLGPAATDRRAAPASTSWLCRLPPETMTRAPELAAAIEAGDAAACARVLAGLTEPARRELYRAVSSRLEELDTA